MELFYKYSSNNALDPQVVHFSFALLIALKLCKSQEIEKEIVANLTLNKEIISICFGGRLTGEPFSCVQINTVFVM